MITTLFSNPIVFLILAPILVISIAIHEFAHAFVADRLGDPTPRSQGRVTLNPLAHLDLIGTIMLLLVGFGWGKPVIFDPYNLKNKRRDILLIALAGPLSNILLATLIAFLLPWLPLSSVIWQTLIMINIALATFNLLPIHPLDGGKILSGLLPRDLAYEYDEILSQYGLFILIALVFIPIGGQTPIDYLVRPVMNLIITAIFGVTTFLHSLI